MNREFNIKCSYDHSDYGKFELETDCDSNEIANALYQIFMNVKTKIYLAKNYYL